MTDFDQNFATVCRWIRTEFADGYTDRLVRGGLKATVTYSSPTPSGLPDYRAIIRVDRKDGPLQMLFAARRSGRGDKIALDVNIFSSGQQFSEVRVGRAEASFGYMSKLLDIFYEIAVESFEDFLRDAA
jgi:hypothetical protein